MSSPAAEATRTISLGEALERIAGRAPGYDRSPRFPRENFEDLLAARALQSAAERPGALEDEIALVRAVAAVDASTARILDGHLNGVERLARGASGRMLERELLEIREGRLLLGVWGADPIPGEGPPAQLIGEGERLRLRGFKTFCSGAGGVDRALVVAAAAQGERRLAYLDTSEAITVDRDWYRASGLRSSESHRVEFHETPVMALLGRPGELSEEPWFSRDAVRTTATWVGLADCILGETLKAGDPDRGGEVQAHDVGRMRIAHATIERWIEHAAGELGSGVSARAGADPHARELAALCRVAISEASREIARLAATVGGSRALTSGGALDRARRDLDVFLLQKRLDPAITALGRSALRDGLQ